jgi:hypothetical protein
LEFEVWHLFDICVLIFVISATRLVAQSQEPITKFQTKSKDQPPNSKPVFRELEFEVWHLFGICVLIFVISASRLVVHPSISPQPVLFAELGLW